MAGIQAGERNAGGNLKAADADMKLTREEKDLYQHHLANLYGPGGVSNTDGSTSTVYSMTVESDGKYFTLPTVWGGRILSQDDAFAHASKIGLSKFPSYKTAEEAESRYSRMHDYMEKDSGGALRPAGIKAMVKKRANTIFDGEE